MLENATVEFILNLLLTLEGKEMQSISQYSDDLVTFRWWFTGV